MGQGALEKDWVNEKANKNKHTASGIYIKDNFLRHYDTHVLSKGVIKWWF